MLFQRGSQMQNKNTIQNAIGKWSGILQNFGINEKYLDKKHGPCPICMAGKDRFRYIDKGGSGSYFCSQCGFGDGFDLLMKMQGWSFVDAMKEVDKIIGTVEQVQIKTERSEAEKIYTIKKTLKECRKVTPGDPVWLYLNRRTGIEEIPSDIRYHSAMYHTEGGFYPAMVSIVRNRVGAGVTLHRTYLTETGEKAEVKLAKKFMEGKKLNGGSVRLSGIAESIGISEGIESAISAGIIHSMPVWAATNSVLLEQWEPPEGIKQVFIFGDNDISYTGQAAAYNLAKRLVREKYDVIVQIPKLIESDWNDYHVKS